MKAILATALALAFIAPAHASTKHHASLNCGWPRPDAGCAGSGSSTPAPGSPVKASDVGPLITQLLSIKDQFIADATQADVGQFAVINPQTGVMFDPIGHMCMAGIPAGAAGQPAVGGLIAWVQGLQSPVGAAGLPPLSANPGPIELAAHARLVVLAGQAIVGGVINDLTNVGVPVSLRQSCGSLINDAVMNVASFAALLARFMPH